MILPKESVAAEEATSSYPAPYNLGPGNGIFRRLSDAGGLTQYGVLLETMAPGAISSQMHWESHEDEFLYMLEGALTVIEDGQGTVITRGDCCAWKAGAPPAHHLKNHTDEPAVYLMIGSRNPQNVTTYPGIDLIAKADGYYHLDGTKYPERES